MTLQEVIQVELLLGDTDVAALVGDRIYPGVLPAHPILPAVTYQLISSPRDQTQSGPAFVRPRFRWNCFALTYDESVEVAIAVARASRAFHAWVDAEADQHELDTGLFRRRLETLAWSSPPEGAP
jgi:hypothetical protein